MIKDHLPLDEMGLETNAQSVILSPVALPMQDNVDFCDTAFFQTSQNARLPTPEEIRRRNQHLHPDLSPNYQRPPLVSFADLKMIVKYGRDITIEEGQCYWFMQRYMGQSVPGPEIYGWRYDGKETFLYLELIEGDTLDSVWDSLSESSRLKLCAELRGIVHSWRQLARGPSEEFVGQSNIFFLQVRVSRPF